MTTQLSAHSRAKRKEPIRPEVYGQETRLLLTFRVFAFIVADIVSLKMHQLAPDQSRVVWLRR